MKDVRELPRKLRVRKGRRSRPLKIFHGPVNTGGIAWRLSRLQRQRGLQADCWMFNPHPRKPQCDIGLHLAKDSRFGRAMMRLATLLFCLRNYDVLHFYAAKTLLPGGWDLPILKLFRKRLIMSYCGSDVRLFRIDRQRNAFPDLLTNAGYTPDDDGRKIRRLKWQGRWIDRVTAPRDAKAPARLAFPPQRISEAWVNNIDVLFDDCQDGPPPPLHDLDLGDGSGPLVIHAPTNEDRKGTAIIEAALHRLADAGVEFSYKRVQNMTHVEAMAWIRHCDILADQMVIGSFGNLALEGMRMGKPVCVHVMQDLLDDMDPPMPIININPGNVEHELRRLIEDGEHRVSFDAPGRAFVAAHLDLEAILGEIEGLYAGGRL